MTDLDRVGDGGVYSSLYLRYPDLALPVVAFCNSTDADATQLGDRGAEFYVTAFAAEP